MFWPSGTVLLEVEAPVDEVRARLTAAVEPWQPFRVFRGHRPFEGTVSGPSFRVARVVVNYRNGSRPWLYGNFSDQGARTRVRVELRQSAWSRWIDGVGLASTGLLTAFVVFHTAATGDWSWGDFIPPGMLASILLTSWGGFALEARWSLALLRETLRAATVSEERDAPAA